MDTQRLTNHVLEKLQADAFLGTDRVGDADVPSSTPLIPYLILTQRITSQGLGGMDDPEEDREFIFEILCVGRSRQQTQWISDKAKAVMTGQLRGTFYDTDAVTVLGNVQGVSIDSIGGIVKTGEDLFQQQDSYRVKAGK